MANSLSMTATSLMHTTRPSVSLKLYYTRFLRYQKAKGLQCATTLLGGTDPSQATIAVPMPLRQKASLPRFLSNQPKQYILLTTQISFPSSAVLLEARI